MHSQLPYALKRSIHSLAALLVVFLPKLAVSQIPTRPTYFGASCSGNSYSLAAGNYTRGSSYEQNLNTVFSDLVSHASSGSRFYNSSSGTTNTTYGQYYCRGDISAQLCHDCIKDAVVVGSDGGLCFPIKRALILFRECSLWYDNVSNVGVWNDSWTPGWRSSGNDVSDPTKFGKVLTTEMDALIKKAAFGGDPLKFATGDEMVTQLETVYCLVQCSPDIVGADCEGCLRTSLRFMFDNIVGSEWGLVFYPTCQMRYALSKFYSDSSSASAPPPRTTSPPSVDAPPSTPGKKVEQSGKKTIIIIGAVVGCVFLVFGLSIGIWFCLCRRNNSNSSQSTQLHNQRREIIPDDPEIGNIESFGFREIEEATAKFSPANKLGEGGYGIVYKGLIPTKQIVAIKRLSKNSFQGIKEFKTELAVVAKLQHRNLVRLVGFCVQNEERILVYEYLSSLSLDKFLFDATKSFKLDWSTRYRIVEGIASGLRYLHIDSLLTIVHRDLKSSNILLDEDMNPKIGDFGLAKLVKINETSAHTSRIGGTFGYMAPEYAMAGRFSTKSDIYSFGIIVLEIVSGKSISHFHDPVNGEGLLHHAWRKWNEKDIEGLIDPSLQNNYSRVEAERCLHIAMLCVQDDSATRPNIRLVVGMIENQSLELPYPSPPSTFLRSPVGTSALNSEIQHPQNGYEGTGRGQVTAEKGDERTREVTKPPIKGNWSERKAPRQS